MQKLPMDIEIQPVLQEDYLDLSIMVGELLNEIMTEIKDQAFNYDQAATLERAKDLISSDRYWVFVAKDTHVDVNVGFISLYESFSLYAEGAYGTIPELYVRPSSRSKSIGKHLLEEARRFAAHKGWKRLEVTTPSLPEFEKTLHFYLSNSFEVSGGKKLKMDINN